MLKPTGNKLFVKKVIEEIQVGAFTIPPSNNSYIKCEIVADNVDKPFNAKYVLVQKQFLNTEIEQDLFIIDTFCVDAIEVEENKPIEKEVETIPDQEAITNPDEVI